MSQALTSCLQPSLVVEPEIVTDTNKVRRTAFLSSGRDSYGVRRSLESLFRAFVIKGVEPTIVCLQDGDMMEFAAREGFRAVLCPIGTPPNFGSLSAALQNFRFMFEASARLAKTLAESDVDRVIVRQPYQVPVAARAAWLARVPGYWLMPNLVGDRYPLRLNAWVYDLLLARYRMTAIANSAFTRTSLINRFGRSAVAHLGIDPAEFDAGVVPAARSRYGFAASDAVFGVFARVVPFKGQHIFIRAVAQCLAQYPQIRVLICGGPLDSEYGKSLRAEIDALGLEGKVLLTGPSSQLQDSLPALYSMCDVIVNSRLDAEPFGLSVIEGMLTGKPLLVHALGGPAETVADGEHGWHVTDPSVAGFAKGIRRAMADRADWSRLGVNAARHARSAFTHVHAAERILAVMEEPSPWSARS